MANYQCSLGLFLHLWYITHVSLWHNPVTNHAYRTQTHLQQVPRSTNWVLKRECLPRIGWISQQKLPVAFAGDEMKDSRKWSNSSINISTPETMFDFYFTVTYLNRLLVLTDHVVLLDHYDVSASGIEIGIMHCMFQVVVTKWHFYLHVPSTIVILVNVFVFSPYHMDQSLTLHLQATQLGALPCQ